MKKYEEDICINKGDFLIVKTKEIEFHNPTVFVTFPTPGIVGPIIARQMISSLDLEEIGFFKSSALSPVTIFMDNVLKHPYLLYANKEGTILLVTIDYPVKIRPEQAVVITAAEEEVVNDLKQYGTEMYEHGVVLGLSGAFTSEALLREIVGIVLMTPATAELPDPEAAVTLINVMNKYFGFKIETAELLDQAAKIKQQLAMIAEKQQSMQQPIVPMPKRMREGFV